MIDTHSHLFDEAFYGDLDEAVLRAKKAGVTRIYMPNVDDETIDDLRRSCRSHAGYLIPLMGLHPTSVDSRYRERLEAVRRELERNLHETDNYQRYAGIGEVGMDLYWDRTYLREQQRVLDEQIQWALHYDLPLIIHCREAFAALFEVMKDYRNTPLRGIFHSFTGTEEELEEVMMYERFKVGVNGVFTFKKSPLPALFKRCVPLGRVVVETDSPYLTPVPHRGGRNESAYVADVVRKVALAYEHEEGEIDRITTQNALEVFKKSDRVFKIH